MRRHNAICKKMKCRYYAGHLNLRCSMPCRDKPCNIVYGNGNCEDCDMIVPDKCAYRLEHLMLMRKDQACG